MDPRLTAELGSLRLLEYSHTGLAADTSHALAVTHGNRPTQVRPFRTLPATDSDRELTVVLASCYYGHFNRDASYLAALQSDFCKGTHFKLLVGDNLYADVAPDQEDLKGGFHETAHHYRHYWWETGYGSVLERFPTYTTWDDHEFWNNYPEPQKHLGRTRGNDYHEYKAAGLECMRAFQAVLNGPVEDSAAGPWQRSYEIDAGLVSFLVADIRSQRTRLKSGAPRLMPERELRHLERWARTLKRPGVLALGAPLWKDTGGKHDYNPGDFAAQHERIWRAIADSPADILILSGDIHTSRVLEMAVGERTVHEVVSSPACHIPDYLSSVAGFLDIDYHRQAKSQVKATFEAPPTSVAPRVLRYPFGTSAQNTFAVLRFSRTGSEYVKVGCSFVEFGDRGPGRLATADPLKFKDGPTWSSQFPVCHRDWLTTLRVQRPNP